MQIGIISPSIDYHAAAVAWGLRRLGAEASVISPTDLTVHSFSLSVGADHSSVLLKNKDKSTTEMLSFAGFWNRRTSGIPEMSPSMHPQDIEVARKDWEAHYRSIMLFIAGSGLYCLNKPISKYFEETKPYQLQTAKSAGLRIPLTYVGNDVIEMRRIFREHEKVAFKTLTSNNWFAEDSEGEYVKASFTQLISTDSEVWEQLHLSPAIIQEYIPKSYEVRITMIGSELVSIGINSQLFEFSKIDWREKRIYSHKEAFFLIENVPNHIREGIQRYCAAMELEFCAFDFIVTPSNEWVFLEGNNSGQFLWCEAMLPPTNLLEKFCRYLAMKCGCETSDLKISISDFEKSDEGLAVLSRFRASLKPKRQAVG